MLENLKQLFNDALILASDELKQNEMVHWFKTTDGTIFGIKANALNDRELKLMTLQFQVLDDLTPEPLSQRDETWEAYLHFNKSKNLLDDINAFSFIHFYIKDTHVDVHDFKAAATGFLPGPLAVVWHNGQEGVIVVESNEPFAIEEFSDLLAVDLYIDAVLMNTPVIYDLEIGFNLFQCQTELFAAAKHMYPERHTFEFNSLLALGLIIDNKKINKQLLFHHLYEKFNEIEDELLETVMVFLRHNMNVTTAANALYIHRNSLQYRLDSFQKKTGLDVKTFNDAIAFQLAYISLRHFDIV